MEPPGGRRGQALIDALVSLACAVIAVGSVLHRDSSAPYDFPTADGRLVGLALLSALALAVRRRWPLAVCLVVVTTVFTIGALRWNAGSTPAFVLIAVYTVGAASGRRYARAGLAYTYAGIAVLIALRAPYFDHPFVLIFVLVVTGAWLLGRWMRHRRAEREAALATALAAEEISSIEAECAVQRERLHIARELHDVVSHTLSVIAVQSGVERYRLEKHGASADDRSRTALQVIETSSRAALSDLRRLLGVLRADPTPAGTPRAVSESAASDERPDRLWESGRVLEGWVDGAVAVVLTALGIGLAFVDNPSSTYHYPRPDTRLILLIVAGCLPIVLRRRWPVQVFLLSAACSVAVAAFGWDPDWVGLAAFVALYSVAAWRAVWVSAACWLVSLGADVLIMTMPIPHSDGFGSVPGLQGLVPWLVGVAAQRWRRQQAAATAHAIDVRRTQAATTTRAVFAERLRIAAELHDVVSHTLSAIAVQSAVLRQMRLPEAAGSDAAFLAIDDASHAALQDLRRMLELFRDDSDTSAASLAPTPGLFELGVLVSAHRATHGPVELNVGPGTQRLPESVQLNAFRLVQEALTNVRKHAHGAEVQVLIALDDACVVVRVEDCGPSVQLSLTPSGPRDMTSEGFGLKGMRERAAMFGGHLDAGPIPGGGFRVEARLPVLQEDLADA